MSLQQKIQIRRVVKRMPEENKAQAKFTAQLKAFANKYKAHVICIAHPRKTAAGTTFNNDDVSGSSAINFSGLGK